MVTLNILRNELCAYSDSITAEKYRSGESAPEGGYIAIGDINNENGDWPDKIIHNPEGGILPPSDDGWRKDYIQVPELIFTKVRELMLKYK